MREQATNWEKIFIKDIFHKGLLSKIYEECLKFNNKNITQFKNGPKASTDTPSRKIYR
jgi:hypothetical protein